METEWLRKRDGVTSRQSYQAVNGAKQEGFGSSIGSSSDEEMIDLTMNKPGNEGVENAQLHGPAQNSGKLTAEWGWI